MQSAFALIIIFLTSLMRQRISVPELIDQKLKNFFALIFGFISICSCIILTFFYPQTLEFSKYFGLIENIFSLLNMQSSFLFCFLTFEMLKRISFPEYPTDVNYLRCKRLLLIFMFIQLFFYTFNYIILSFYNPVIYPEKMLVSCMIYLINLNAIFYYIMQVAFVFTLRYDLYYVNLHLEIRPDIEYFIAYE